MVICTYAGAQVSGIIMRSLGLPSLLGQLLFGLFLSLFLSSPLPLSLTSPLKSLSLTVLLIRAGISINISNLLPEFYLTLGLSFLPFVIEAGVVAGFSWFLLNEASAFMIGALISDVSPAVTTPIFLSMLPPPSSPLHPPLKRFTSVLLASSNLNSVVSIHCFYIAFEVTFHTGSALVRGIIGVAESIIGPVMGMVAGWGITKLGGERGGIVSGSLMGMSATFLVAGMEFKLSGAGALAALFTAISVFNPLPWRSLPTPLPSNVTKIPLSTSFSSTWGQPASVHRSDSPPPPSIPSLNTEVSLIYRKLWENVFEALLFGLLGAEIDFTKIDQRTVLVGTAIIACGLVFRFGATYLCCRSIGGYCYKRSLFVATCWMPKATVQAALCTIALDFVRSDAWWKLESKGHPHYSETEMNAYRVKWEGRATDVLNVGVLSIILTAPICAYIIPKLVRPLVEEPLLLKLKETETVRQRNSFGTQGQAQVNTSIDGSQTWVETPTKSSGMSYDMEEIKRVKSV
ncbi:hypothetical protein TrVE_jg11468 [Triparma verrucosa]|uniref:Cation/H+ exchanger transmembrane domain-containing protein n=1 Tax=Triparma verrucosa TaxID=1606542 RepID=A0A9W7F284_9STRA|nr:hypothetical protein TrVE_jg11468 [Triparma verrucosa]